MLREQCQVGMIIEFGKGNGEWTKGEIIKINPKMAKVKTLESRGHGAGGFAGAVWSVSYALMRPLNGTANTTVTVNVADEPFPYSPFTMSADNFIMEAILDVYVRLSPEWLTADGERPVREVHALRGRLENKLSHLFKALGRPVSESVAYAWDEERKKKNQAV